MIGKDERAADGITHHLHASRRHLTAACARRSAESCEEPVHEAPESARDDDGEHDEDDEAEQHHAPGFLPTPACADVRLSSARLAAWPSGLSGASAITCFHASPAPSRSCLPNAFTMPTFSNVLTCFGSSVSD